MKKILVAATAAAILSLIPTGAQAKPTKPAKQSDLVDVRPCVMPREVWTTPLNDSLNRRAVERDWEVQGLGTYEIVPVFGMYMWTYPVCDAPNRKAIAAFGGQGNVYVVGIWSHDSLRKITSP